MEPLTCDVCGAEAAGVYSSRLGPCSFGYCGECSAYGCEPYRITVGMVAINGRSLDEFAEWFHHTIFATCLRAGKTAAEFWDDVAREAAEMDAELAERAKMSGMEDVTP